MEWTQPDAVYRAINGADVVLALAAWTDVAGAQLEPAACVRDTVTTVQATLRAASRCSARVLYLSTDYVLPLLRGEAGAGVYAAAKLVAEQLVLGSPDDRHRVARAAFVTEAQASRWAWVDGHSVACRLWADQLVPLLVQWVAQAAQPDAPRLVHLGSTPCTLEQLLRQRFPDHPALQKVVRCPEQLQLLGKGLRPSRTHW